MNPLCGNETDKVSAQDGYFSLKIWKLNHLL